MKANELINEEISAFADGELDEYRTDGILRVLREPVNQNEWHVYHQIGDVMRSEEMAFELSGSFSARMAARLDAEPLFMAPEIIPATPQQRNTALGMRTFGTRRLLVPGLAAAAAA